MAELAALAVAGDLRASVVPVGLVAPDLGAMQLGHPQAAQTAAGSPKRTPTRRRRSSMTKRRDRRDRNRRRKRSTEGGAQRQKKKQKTDYDRSDYSRPLPVDLTVYCFLDGMYREATIQEAIRRDQCPVTLPTEEEEEALLPALLTKTPLSAVAASRVGSSDGGGGGGDADGEEKKDDEGEGAGDHDDDDADDDDLEDPATTSAEATGSAEAIAAGARKPQIPAQNLSLPVEDRIRGHEFAYYVHFVWYDRRMDDYVTRQRIRFLDEVPPKLVGITPRPALEPDPVIGVPSKAGGGGGGGYGGAGNQHGGGGGEDDHHGDAATKVRNIAYITLGQHQMKTWYHTPLPIEYKGANNLLFCEFCLSFFRYQEELDYHMQICDVYHPPGNEIYRSHERNVTICMFEVDGTKEHQWAENLCYISKLFLEHKTLNEDTSIFLFYVLCEVDESGCHIVGYFSKEKIWTINNLACILTLPCHQRKGYGKFLIAFSYALSRMEHKTGSPERPLSDLGRRSYMAFWTEVLAQELILMQEELTRAQASPPVVLMEDDPGRMDLRSASSDSRVVTTIRELSQRTAISVTDVQDCLKSSSMIVCKDNQWCLDAERIRELHEQRIAKAKQRQEKLDADPTAVSVEVVRPEFIRWTPYSGRRRRSLSENP